MTTRTPGGTPSILGAIRLLPSREKVPDGRMRGRFRLFHPHSKGGEIPSFAGTPDQVRGRLFSREGKRGAAALFALLLGLGLAHAEEAKPTPAPQPITPQPNALGADMAAQLAKAGFTSLQVMPNAILVRAKDKNGNPVAMVLDPHSMTEVVTLDPHAGSAAAGNGTTPLTGSSTFPTVLPSARLASTLVGLKVRDVDGTEIGTIKDLAVDHGGVQAYIIGAGGVLGIGDRYVAVAPLAITLVYDEGTNSYRATMNATADQLKAAPPFTYEGTFKAGRQ